ncbi:MAG: TolC family protein [Verrucomicrobia bacterium]|nr:TolC family protein [Verrucomicrobiota bacterium]
MQFRQLLCLALALAALMASAQTNMVKTNVSVSARIRPISLRECLDLALQRNLDVQIARHSPNAARFELKAAYGSQYDPVLSFGARKGLSSMPPMADIDKRNIHSPYELDTVTLDGNLSGRLTPGLSYKLGGFSSEFSADTHLLSMFPATFPPNNTSVGPFLNPPLLPPYYTVNGSLFGTWSNATEHFYETQYGLQLKQALLKDFWIDAGHMQIQVNKKNLKISEQSLLMQVMTTTLAVQSAYYDLIYAHENVKVMQKALELAQELLDGDRKRVATGTLAPLGEKLAEAQLETARANLLAAEQLLEVQRNALRTLLTDDYAQAPEELFQPTDGLTRVWEAPDRSASLQKALSARPDLIQARLEVEKQGIVVRYTSNQRLPSLDLVASYGANGINDNSREATFGHIGDYSIGVVFRMPLGNMEARNKYYASKEVQAQLLLQLKKIELNVLVQVDDVLRSLEKVFKRVGATRQARIYAEVALEGEKKKLADGAITSFMVSEYEDRLAAARTAEILALVDYNKALAQLAFNEGSTLEKNQIQVEFK